MDEAQKCECGNTMFWWFGDFVRCPNCYNEMRHTRLERGGNENWFRRFNKETCSYEGWEPFQ